MRYTSRHSLFLVALLVLFSLALAGCGGGDDGVVSTSPGGGGTAPVVTTATVSGRVTASDTGAPIPGATVELNSTPQTTTTDADGNYSFTGVEPGLHTLRITTPGRLPWQTDLVLEAGEACVENVGCWPQPGRLVVFQSYADDLVAGDVADGYCDIFVRDVEAGTTTKVSVLPTGKAGGNSGFPVMSDCTRWVVFESYAQLVAADDDDSIDVFRFDRQTGTMQCLTLGYQFNKDYCDSGDLNPNTSGDGRYTTYEWNVGFSEGKFIFVFDGDTGETHLASVGPPPAGIPNGCCKRPVVAAYGRYVAFDSSATNLVPGDDPTTDRRDIFLYDSIEGRTEKVSVAADGSFATNECSQWASISADGRYVAFRSNATNLVDPAPPAGMVYVRDRQTDTTELVSLDSVGAPSSSHCYRPTISADGTMVAFYTSAALVPEDTNGTEDVYLRNLVTDTTSLASWNALGTGAGGSNSWTPVLAFDGSFVLFGSNAQDLVTGQPASGVAQVFVRDLLTLVNGMVSQTPTAAPGNNYSDTRESI